MSVKEPNPDSPMLRAMREQWQKLCAIMVHKMGGKTSFGASDIEKMSKAFHGELPTIVVYEKNDRVHLEVMAESQALRMSRGEHHN